MMASGQSLGSSVRSRIGDALLPPLDDVSQIADALCDSKISAGGASLLGPLKLPRSKTYDIVFIMDVTGDMSRYADCVREATSTLRAVIAKYTRKLRDGPSVGGRQQPRKQVRIGMILHAKMPGTIGHRDVTHYEPPAFHVLRVLDLTPHWPEIRKFLDDCLVDPHESSGKSPATSGRCSLELALREARTGSTWDERSVTKTVVVIGRDEPLEPDRASCQAEVLALRARGIRVVVVHCPVTAAPAAHTTSLSGGAGSIPSRAATVARPTGTFYDDLAMLGGCRAASISLPCPEATPLLVAGLSLKAVCFSSFQTWCAADGEIDAPFSDDVLLQLEDIDVKGRDSERVPHQRPHLSFGRVPTGGGGGSASTLSGLESWRSEDSKAHASSPYLSRGAPAYVAHYAPSHPPPSHAATQSATRFGRRGSVVDRLHGERRY